MFLLLVPLVNSIYLFIIIICTTHSSLLFSCEGNNESYVAPRGIDLACRYLPSWKLEISLTRKRHAIKFWRRCRGATAFIVTFFLFSFLPLFLFIFL